MEDWKQLTEGLEISVRDGVIPPELVERLDLVYYLGNDGGEPYHLSGIDLQHSVQDVSGVVTEVRKILIPKISSSVKVLVSDGGTISDYTDRSEIVRKMRREDKTLDELFIFGAILEPALGDFAATPVFCLGERPEGKDVGHLGYISYQGLYPVGNSGGLIRINQNEWPGRIDVRPDGKGSVYFGNACSPSDAEAVVFEKLIPFDLEKRLVLARSPNGSMNFDALQKVELPEGDRNFQYALVYDKVKPMRENRTWAVNTPQGLNWEQNTYLDLFTRKE